MLFRKKQNKDSITRNAESIAAVFAAMPEARRDAAIRALKEAAHYAKLAGSYFTEDEKIALKTASTKLGTDAVGAIVMGKDASSVMAKVMTALQSHPEVASAIDDLLSVVR